MLKKTQLEINEDYKLTIFIWFYDTALERKLKINVKLKKKLKQKFGFKRV